jgi:signal transduction histidine kinase
VSVTLEAPATPVLADPDGLAVVLRNLLDNALKFSAQAQPPRITIGGREEGNEVIVWVQDNGVGFDMKYHDRIFDIFQRLHRQEDYPGTGIGLALVKKAVQRMGGRVWAESAPGQGATFYLALPKG